MPRRYWLLKSEPDVFSFGDLRAAPRRTTGWDGVRNFEARNLLRDRLRKGDGVLFYHSNADPPGIAGTAEVVREGYPDPTQFDPKSAHYDPAAKPENPRWFQVDVKYAKAFPAAVTLEQIRKAPLLKRMALLRRGRLSVQPVTGAEWKLLLKMGGL